MDSFISSWIRIEVCRIREWFRVDFKQTFRLPVECNPTLSRLLVQIAKSLFLKYTFEIFYDTVFSLHTFKTIIRSQPNTFHYVFFYNYSFNFDKLITQKQNLLFLVDLYSSQSPSKKKKKSF